MPGRLTIAFILLLFVGMIFGQGLRNYGGNVGEGPQLKPSMELAAEDGTTNWLIRYNQQRLGDAQTQVTKTSLGVYVLKQNVELDGDLESFMGPIGVFVKAMGIKLNDFRATIRTEMELTYLGTMRKLDLNFVAQRRAVTTLTGTKEQPPPPRFEDPNKQDRDDNNNLLRLTMTAEATQLDQLNFKGMFAMASMRFPIDDVKIKHRSRDSFLSNISPTDCMAGIRLGQRWQTPVLDPTQMMLSAYTTSKTKDLNLGNTGMNPEDLVKTKIAEMRVLDELKEMEWRGSKVACYLVQSQDRGSKMQIWVNASNYRVLKQTFESDRHLLELIREPSVVQ